MSHGVKTNGEGRSTTAHLNLTVSLADVWAKSPHEAVRIKPRAQGRPKGAVPIFTRPQFAGDDRYERNAT